MLSGNAVKLLNAMAYQDNGHNNGDFTVTWSVMHEQHGFRSRETLNNSRKELLAANLIHLTRQGDKSRCGLYAVTWNAIDECDGKLDCSPTKVPIRSTWDNKKLSAEKPKRMDEKKILYFAELKEKKALEQSLKGHD